MRALVVALLLLAPAASARPLEAPFVDEARDLLDALERSVHRARTATVDHAFGVILARDAAHVMRQEEARLDTLWLHGLGLEPPPGRRGDHAALVEALALYQDAIGLLEECYRPRGDGSCDEAHARIDTAETYRDAAASRLGRSAFS